MAYREVLLLKLWDAWVNGQWVNGWSCGCARINESMVHRFSESMSQWTNESVNQWFNESLNHWIKPPRNTKEHWINESVNFANLSLQSAAHFCRLYLPRCSKHYFWRVFLWNRALATVWYTFCRTDLAKVPGTPQLFDILKCKWSSWSSRYIHSCAHFVDNFPKSRPAPAKTEPYCGDPESVLTRGFKHSRIVTLLYCSHTRTALANDLMDMMTKLPQDSSLTRKCLN